VQPEEAAAYERMGVFKRQLKLAVKIIIDDVHKNYEAYKAVRSMEGRNGE